MPHLEEFDFEDAQHARRVYGYADENLRLLSAELTVDVHARGTRVRIEGDPIDTKLARRTLEQLYSLSLDGHDLGSEDIVRSVHLLRHRPTTRLSDVMGDAILSTPDGRRIVPKTWTQKCYVDAIRENDIVFGLGPAGTGKTYLAMAMAVHALQQKRVKRLILTRPAVEAGEKLGFLPGDLQEKVSPYLRPLNDALHEMMDFERIVQFTERGVIEIAPLAFMRGRTLNDAFVILDEAQNATRQQMKMFLTRIGFGSRAVITGDGSQVDLARRSDSGLRHAVSLLGEVPGIGVTTFAEEDVVRHPLVKRIINAYEADENAQNSRRLTAVEHEAQDLSGARGHNRGASE